MKEDRLVTCLLRRTALQESLWDRAEAFRQAQSKATHHPQKTRDLNLQACLRVHLTA
jgi:hypothetical protein